VPKQVPHLLMEIDGWPGHAIAFASTGSVCRFGILDQQPVDVGILPTAEKRALTQVVVSIRDVVQFLWGDAFALGFGSLILVNSQQRFPDTPNGIRQFVARTREIHLPGQDGIAVNEPPAIRLPLEPIDKFLGRYREMRTTLHCDCHLPAPNWVLPENSPNTLGLYRKLLSKTSVRIAGKWLFQNRHHKSASPPTSNSIRAQQDILVPYCVLPRCLAGV
jgi:hypothetical protein